MQVKGFQYSQNQRPIHQSPQGMNPNTQYGYQGDLSFNQGQRPLQGNNEQSHQFSQNPHNQQGFK